MCQNPKHVLLLFAFACSNAENSPVCGAEIVKLAVTAMSGGGGGGNGFACVVETGLLPVIPFKMLDSRDHPIGITETGNPKPSFPLG